MELLQNLWNVLVTKDEVLTTYIVLLISPIEFYVSMKLFTTVLNISYTKKQKNMYIIIMTTLLILSTIFIRKEYSVFIHLIITPIIIKKIFNTSLLKSLIAEILPTLVIVILESIYFKICFILFELSPETCINIILFRIPFTLFIYLTIYGISKIVKHLKLNLNIFEYLDIVHKRMLAINVVFILISICTQFYLFIFYDNVLPLYITLISLSSLIIYSIISIYSITKTIRLEVTKHELEQSKLHNKTLEILYSNISAFRHDFFNMITALGGYINTKDYNGLEKYYSTLLDECVDNNNLYTLNPTIINNPAVYNILANKYYKADELHININLNIFIDLNQLKLNIYDFTRILGILLDNAIEACSSCEEKIINISISDSKHCKQQTLIIENTYSDKTINIDDLFKRGYTSKSENPEQHGLGLWQVSKIVNKHDNLILNTSKDEKFFKQELAIYY